jgi:putative acetyltransferase
MPRSILIRSRVPADDKAIAAVVRAAFAGDAEILLIEALRRDGDMVAEFIAHVRDDLIGHIAYSRLEVRSGARALRAVALAPLAVAPSHQRQGAGQALMRHSLEALRTGGEELAVVLGHPRYYERVGFSSLLAKLLEAPYAGDAFMALELQPGVLDGFRWQVAYPPAFSRPLAH